ncbi:MAG: hypothetical protein J6K44_04205 [Clostridia bacterium]|nr:hypothetical protein [Clostridia bacterium]MBP3583227.1 hypothetical protein [Clostridia bacterium]
MKNETLCKAYENACLEILFLDTRDVLRTSEPQNTTTELGSSGSDPAAWL